MIFVWSLAYNMSDLSGPTSKVPADLARKINETHKPPLPRQGSNHRRDNVIEQKRNTNLFVKVVFGNAGSPNTIDRKFYPIRDDFRQKVYRKRRKTQNLFSIRNMSSKEDKGMTAAQEDNWLFRTSATIRSSDLALLETKDPYFLLVCQSRWQQQLLHEYAWGNSVFLDATYKTMKYALPLFFLCVFTQMQAILLLVQVYILEIEKSIICRGMAGIQRI